MTREELKQIMGELLAELISEARDDVEPADPVVVSFDTSLGDVFAEASCVVALIEENLEFSNGVVNAAFAYSTMVDIITYGIDAGWIKEDKHWQEVIDRFEHRANELVGVGEEDKIDELVIPPWKLFSIADNIVWGWSSRSKRYARDEFTSAEIVQSIRAGLLSLRTAGYLKYDGWFRELISLLNDDWKILGGGFGSNLGGGIPGASYAGS